MKIKKAVVTAAGRNQRGLPLQTLVDRDRVQKTALRIIVEEALNAGMAILARMTARSKANPVTSVDSPKN